MQLRKVTLKHFRSIKECTISVSDVTALVGENNSGKSSLLRALNLFFNYEFEKSDLFSDRHQYSPQSIIQIILTFGNLPHDKQVIEKSQNDELTLRLQVRGAAKKRTLQYRKHGKWNQADIDFVTDISKYIRFVFIPPTRTKQEISWQEKTLLKLCVDAYLEQATGKRDTFTKNFTSAAKDLENRALKKIAKQARQLYSLNHDFEYAIEYKPSLTYKDFLTSIQFRIKEKDKFYDLEDCGTGIQSLTIIALHRLLAEIQGANVIFGLEEPETNLHPQAQKELIHSIKNAAENNEFSQIICTTHSPVVIDQLLHQQVKLFRKVDDPVRGFKTEVTEIDDNFFDENDISDFKYYNFHQYRNSEFFFARYVVVVEGEADAEVIQLLLRNSGYNLDLHGVSFVYLRGVGSLKYPYALLKKLELPHLVVVDKDFFFPYKNGKKNDSRNAEGFFQYNYVMKEDAVISRIIPSQRTRRKLKDNFKKSHQDGQDILDQHNMVCMRWCLEMDIISPEQGAKLLYEELNIPEEKQNKAELLIKRPAKIKETKVLLHVIENLPNGSLPRSLQRIKKHILEGIK